jgi:hypothetical protein
MALTRNKTNQPWLLPDTKQNNHVCIYNVYIWKEKEREEQPERNTKKNRDTGGRGRGGRGKEKKRKKGKGREEEKKFFSLPFGYLGPHQNGYLGYLQHYGVTHMVFQLGIDQD